MPIIDAWIQHPTPAFVADPMFASLRRWLGISGPIPEVPLAFTLGALDMAGVDRALVTAWSAPHGWMLTNDHVAEVVEQSEGRLIGVGSVDLTNPVEAAREVRRCADRGFKAIRILPWLWGLPPNDRRYYPVYVACVEAGLPFCTQIGHTGPLRSSEPGRPIPYLEDVLLDFPDLVLVGGHVGAPWMAEVLTLLHKFPNFHVDTSAYKLSRLPSELVTYLKGRGRSRVLFGSNFPMIQPAACLAGLDALDLDDETQALFLGGNAARVFRL
jgi:predicted TIM-barrel fold metal-dependent hydrolase